MLILLCRIPTPAVLHLIFRFLLRILYPFPVPLQLAVSVSYYRSGRNNKVYFLCKTLEGLHRMRGILE
jgi:hypothetical protein